MEDYYCGITLIDGDNSLIIKPIKFNCPDSTYPINNSIESKVTIKAGCFQAEYLADFSSFDYSRFGREIDRLYDNLGGVANFLCDDRFLTIRVVGDGLGHFKADCIAIDSPGYDERSLNFVINFDQTQIKQIVNQVDLILQVFPVIEDKSKTKKKLQLTLA
jgi:hypothetical protein